MSKVIIALPTSNEFVNIFEKTLTGGFSSVNTCSAFDTQILSPNLVDCKDENNILKKDCNYKICYKLRFGDMKEKKLCRVITKILKLDENNQYGFAITKPMPTGCIKFNEDLSWSTFNRLLEAVDLDDKIGQLYIVDIEFDYEQASDRQRTYNEVCPPIIEKKKIIDVFERSTYQLLERYSLKADRKPKSYTPTK